MSLVTSLATVRYLTLTDPIHYTTDNRPLTDLNANTLLIAAAVDAITPSYRTVTAATDPVLTTDYTLTFNFAGTVTETLLNPVTYPGRILKVRTITANTVVSASANVVPLAGGAAGTAILAATAGKWATLQSDGTNWQIIESN